MDERRRLGVQDALWLEMDRPTNLMVVDSLVWTAGPVDWDRMRAVVRERLWDRYHVFRSMAVQGDGHDWYWEEQPGHDLDDHITQVSLPAPGDDAALRAFIGSLRTVPLPRDRPLWQMYCVDGYGAGSAIVTRTHHAIADGIRMVQLAMSLFDAGPDGGAILAPPVRLHAEGSRVPGASLGDRVDHGVRALVDGVVEVAQAVGHGVVTLTGTSIELGRTAVGNPVGAAHNAATLSVAAVGSLTSWVRTSLWPALPGSGMVVDAFSAAPGDVDFARKLLLGTRNDATCWHGSVGTRKAVAWSEPLPLRDVKAVARANRVTLNDVLVTCVAGTLHAYLERHGRVCSSVNWMIPVNLKPLDATLPEELGNSFAIVQLELPVDVEDPLEVLDVVRRRMGRIKHGHEAVLAFRTQEAISGLNRTAYRVAVDLLANRAVGVLTNVPGPPMPVYVAGQKVAGMTGWAPLSGNQPMSFTIYTYDGQVFVGIACDADLVPDHAQIVDGFAEAFRRLQDATG